VNVRVEGQVYPLGSLKVGHCSHELMESRRCQRLKIIPILARAARNSLETRSKVDSFLTRNFGINLIVADLFEFN